MVTSTATHSVTLARRLVALVALLMLGLAARPAAAQIVLSNGVSLGGFSAPAGSEKLFVLAVPPGADSLVIQTACGDPDADIFLRWGAPPTPSVWNYKSDGPSSNESITITDPPSGNLYIVVHAHASFTGLGILGQYWGADDVSVVDLDNGDDVDGLFGATGDDQYFRITLPFSQDIATIKLVGSDPDADLYVRWDDLPTTEDYDAKSTGSSSNESITIANPPSGDLYILVHAYNGYFNATLSVDWNGPSGGDPAIDLDNGETKGTFGGGEDSLRLFAIELPEDTDVVTFDLWDGWGDADLSVRWDEPPTLAQWDESSRTGGNDESITVWYPPSGVVYLLVHGNNAYGGAKIRATYQAWSHFSMKSNPWKNQKLGSSSVKIKVDGSALTSAAMVLAYAGADVDPGSLNAWLKEHNGFTGGSTMKWSAAAEYDGPQGLEYVGPDSVSTMAKLRKQLDQEKLILARSNRYDTTSHWVLIRYYTGNGTSWSNFHYWDPADATPVDRTMGDGWVDAGTKTKVYVLGN